MAQSYHANGAYERALAEAGLAIGLDVKNPDYYLLQSRILATMDRSDDAFEAAQRALDLRPTAHPKVLFACGKLEKAKGNLSEAIALFEATRRSGEDSASLFSALGEAYSQTKQWGNAASAYEMALKRHRKNTAWRLAWARARHHAGKYREAEEKYCELLAINPDLTDAWLGLKTLRKRY